MRSGILRSGAAALASVVALGACSSGGAEPQQSAECAPEGIVSVGEPVPACSFERFDGGRLSLAQLEGKPALINFWASWCPPCIEEMPAFQRVYASLEGKIEFVGANLLGVDGETAAAARSFARSTGVLYPLIFDENGLLYAHFSARLVMPVTILVRPDGVVAYRQFGPLSERSLRAILAEELGVD